MPTLDFLCLPTPTAQEERRGFLVLSLMRRLLLRNLLNNMDMLQCVVGYFPKNEVEARLPARAESSMERLR